MKTIQLVSVLVVFTFNIGGCVSTPTINNYIRDGNTEESLKYINSGGKVNVSDDYGLSPIHMAASKGNIQVLKALIDHGANVNAVEKKSSMTPIHYAAYNKNSAAIKLLIKNGANIDSNDRKGRTALKISSLSGNLDNVRTLVDAGAKLNKMQVISSSALMEAVNGKKINVINFLLESGANASSRDEKGNTPIILSSFTGDPQIFKTLLVHGAKISEENNVGYTPLIIAAYTGNTAIAQVSLMNGADVNHKTKFDRSPLHLSAIGEHIKVMKLLFEHGAQPIIIDTTEDDLFGTAFSHSAYAIWLIKNRIDVNPEYYLNIAIENFHKAKKEYKVIESDADWEISKQAFKSVLSIVFASYAAHTQAHINARASGTGVGYGSGTYRIYGTRTLRNVRDIYKLKKERSAAFISKYEKIISCIKSVPKSDQKKCIVTEGKKHVVNSI